ncbi:MAG: hypothetical protein HZA49_09980 [Planctomycetes bacterium]|nr:hypothetical protein [Planctomycetota bacterium]
MASICLAICGITTKVNLVSGNGFHIAVKKRYRNFLHPTNNRRPDINLYIKTISNHLPIPDTRPSIDLTNKTLRIKGGGFTCAISRKNGLWEGNGVMEENIYQLDTLLRLLYSHFLIKDNGFLIHACGINHENSGYLFAGRSGTGKTTLAKKAPYHNVLSDELVGLRFSGRNPILMGTPFWGEFQRGGQPISCALKGIYFLNKNTRPKLIPLSPSSAMKKLLKLVLFFGIGSRSDITAQQILNSAARYLLCKPTYQINMAKNTHYKTIIRIISHNVR